MNPHLRPDSIRTWAPSQMGRTFGQELRTRSPTRLAPRVDHGRLFSPIDATNMETTLCAHPHVKVIVNAERVRRDLDHDVIRGRRFDLDEPFARACRSRACCPN